MVSSNPWCVSRTCPICGLVAESEPSSKAGARFIGARCSFMLRSSTSTLDEHLVNVRGTWQLSVNAESVYQAGVEGTYPDAMTDQSHPYSVVVVDDELNVRDLLSAALRMRGYDVRAAADGRSALDLIEAQVPDILVLDVMLPDIDGYAIARGLRARGNDVPVLFLTARDAVGDRIAGLAVGGDDYVSKPFSIEEVLLRVEAILRRTGTTSVRDRVLRYADLTMDLDAHQVMRGGIEIGLSATEFSLLHYLLSNADTVVSKTQIIDRVWNSDGRDGRIVDTFISQLRRKIDTAGPPLIHTLRGVGYTLRRDRSGI
ncbi:response regulator transcription factor [Nocardia sp. NPDC055002]